MDGCPRGLISLIFSSFPLWIKTKIHALKFSKKNPSHSSLLAIKIPRPTLHVALGILLSSSSFGDPNSSLRKAEFLGYFTILIHQYLILNLHQSIDQQHSPITKLSHANLLHFQQHPTPTSTTTPNAISIFIFFQDLWASLWLPSRFHSISSFITHPSRSKLHKSSSSKIYNKIHLIQDLQVTLATCSRTLKGRSFWVFIGHPRGTSIGIRVKALPSEILKLLGYESPYESCIVRDQRYNSLFCKFLCISLS